MHYIRRINLAYHTHCGADTSLKNLVQLPNQIFHLSIYSTPPMMIQLLSVATDRPLPDLFSAANSQDFLSYIPSLEHLRHILFINSYEFIRFTPIKDKPLYGSAIN